MAEWSKAAVLKTVMSKGIAGSNPAPTAIYLKIKQCCVERCESGRSGLPAKQLWRKPSWVRIPSSPLYAPVAQWNRASDYGSEGQGFESSRALFSFYFAELMADQFWMRKALEAAYQGTQVGEVPVGAIIIKDETVLSVAHNQREQTKDPTAHAELIAIRTAALATGDWRLTDTTLYVTLEPCPMCAGAILLARIPRVVYATSDPKSGAARTLFNLLQDERLNHQVDIVEGVLAEESRRLLQSFFRERRS